MIKQYPLPLPPRSMMGFDDFLPATCNQEALRWIEAWPRWNEPYLLIQGPHGSGKTHLANLFQSRSQAHILEASDIESGDLRKIVSEQKALILDDAKDIVTSHQEVVFHLMNMVREKNIFLLMTSYEPPASWPLKLQDLRSRLLAIPHATIAAPDETLLSALLVKHFYDHQMTVSGDVIEYILARTERSFSAMRALVSILDRTSLSERRAITVAFVKHVLEEEHFLFTDPAIE